MKLVVDAGIPHAAEAFAGLGEVVCVPGRAITRSHLEDAAALVVRSITRVDETLLRATAVEFVGSATAGTDHLDVEYLERAGIAWAHAPGANADAVAEYVLAVLADAWADPGRPHGAVGVVGLGHVGRRVTRSLRALGRDVLVCDPPLARRVADGAVPDDEPLAELARAETYRPLAELAARCTALTFHVPLTMSGPDPTHHVAGSALLEAVAPGTLIINTSRGGVLDERAFVERAPRRDLVAALDVWEAEPRLHWPLLAHPAIRVATPHVAGYSVDAKLAVNRAMHAALAGHFGATLAPTGSVMERPAPVEVGDLEPATMLAHCLASVTELWSWDARLRGLSNIDDPLRRAAAFDALRATALTRRELAQHRFVFRAPPPKEVVRGLEALGATVQADGRSSRAATS